MTPTESAHPRPTILLVDDQPEIRELLRLTLGLRRRYEVLDAEDGHAAQAILLQTSIDVVVTDVMMPGMDGLELMRWAKQAGMTPTWIVLSGLDSFDAAVKAIQLGAFDFLPKPLPSLEILDVAVRNALAQRRLIAEREQLARDLQRKNVELEAQVGELERLCRRLGEQSTIIQDDLARAEVIQRALLPQGLPAVSGVAVDAYFRPCHAIGGDLYDVIPLGPAGAPGPIAIYVADASGHGVSAAMLSVFVKHRIRPRDDAGQPRAPSAVLAELDAAILAECAVPGLFVTMAYALVEPALERMSIAIAGHPPALIQHADGHGSQVPRTGPALGFAAGATFEDRELPLRRGDRLLFYTDGLLDAGPGRDALATSDLVGIVANPSRSGAGLVQALVQESLARRDARPAEDDVTVVLLSVEPGLSTLDNGTPPSDGTAASEADPEAHVLIGVVAEDGEAAEAIVVVRGRGTWREAATFRDVATGALDAGMAVTVDLAGCGYLDSTFLGTLHVVVTAGDQHDRLVTLQSLRPELRALVEELSMVRVLSRVADTAKPVPAALLSLRAAPGDEAHGVRHVLEAHEVLASLSEQNRVQFQSVVDALRADARSITSAGR